MISTISNKNDFEIFSHNVSTIEDYLYLNLLIKKVKEPMPLSLVLTPKKMKKDIFLDMQKEVSKYDEFLVFCLNNLDKILSYYKEFVKGDRLIDVFIQIVEETKKKDPIKKPLSIITRYDYMFDKNLNKFLQIEFNNTAVSMGFHSSNVTKTIPLIYNNLFDQNLDLLSNNYPAFHIDIMLKAFETYKNSGAYLAIVNSDEEVNIFETRQIEKLLVQNNIKVMMLRMKDIKKDNYYIDKERRVFFKEKEIGLFYFRCFYNPEEFEEEEKINFYIDTEISRCITIPDAKAVLISLKPIQHLIFSEHCKQKYKFEELKELNFLKNITPTFLLSIDFDNVKTKMLDYIVENGGSEKYLMKSFREGGSGDIYTGKTLVDFIANSPIDVLNTYILVSKIQTPETPSIFYKNGKIELVERTISEFGFYEGYVFEKNEKGAYETIYKNNGSWLVRTKNIETLKGGVAVNASSLDCLQLID